MKEEFSEFIDHLESGMPELAKGSSIRHALIAHAKAAHAEHSEMSDFHKKIHDSLDDGHEHKAMHRRMHEHHAAKAEHYKSLHAALGGEEGAISVGSGDVHVGDLHGPKAIRPDGVRLVAPQHVKLVPRGGSNPGGDVSVDPAVEELFSGV